MPDTALRDLVLKPLDTDTQAEDEWSAASSRAPSAASGGEGSAIATAMAVPVEGPR